MAVTNQNKPQGLTPVRYLNGADWTGQASWYFIPQADANAYWPGDLVSPVVGADTIAGLPTITLTVAASSTIVAGVAIAFGASPLGQSQRGGPLIQPTNLTLLNVPAVKAATQNYFALVVDDPMVVFMVQETGAGTTPGTALTQTSSTKNASFVYAAPAAGVAVSGTTLDNGISSGHTPQTVATVTNGYFLRMLGLAQVYDPQLVNYNSFGLYAKWLVKLNNHQFGPSVAAF